MSGADQDAATVRFTLDEVVDRCAQTAAMLADIGHRRDDVAAFLLPNVPEAHWLLWGGQRACRIAPINPLLRPEAIAELLKRVEAKTLFAFGPTDDFPLLRGALAIQGLIPSLQRVVRIGGQLGGELNVPTFSSLLDSAFVQTPNPRNGEEISALFHTGGTTGAPKIAGLTGGNQIASAQGVAQQLGYGEQDVVCAPLPLFHIAGSVVAGLAPLASGSRVLMPGPSGFRDPSMAKQAWRLISDEKATILAAVPTSLGALTGLPVDADLSRLEYVLTGTAPMPSALAERVEAHVGVPVHEGYGMTEAAGGISFAQRGEAAPRGSVGRPIEGLDVRIGRVEVSEVTSEPVSTGEVGAVLLRGSNVFGGYLGDRQRNFTKDGWFDTGDLGRQDTEGRLTLTGRSKDIIIRSGHNLDPEVIEAAALAHPDVLQAAAVAAPDLHAGEVPAVFVQCREGSQLNNAALAAHMTENVTEAPAKPRYTAIVAELPLTSVGKIFKPELRRQAAELWLKEAGVPVEVLLKSDGSLAYAVLSTDLGALRSATGHLSIEIVERNVA